MQIRTLHTLLTISEVGSFVEGARRLNMTLSAVSMQMKVLEQELNADLFDRAQRPPRLTAKGREIVEHARSIVEAEHALLKACLPEGKLQGTFHVGFVLSAGVRLLPRFLKAAGETLPEASFEIETGLSEQLEKKVVDGRLDLAVLTAGETSSNVFDTAVLRTEPLVFALPRSMAGRDENWLLCNLPFMHFAPSSGIGRLIADHVNSLDQQPVKTIVLDGMESIVECVKQGIGFTILPRPDVERYADGALTMRPLSATGLSRDLALVARKSNFTAHQFSQIQRLFD